MAAKELRPHQREAVNAALRALEVPAGATVPERGLRTQVVMATGTGKTLVAARSAAELQAGRVLVLVPSLDLLTQTEAAWREGGRSGPMIGVSPLHGGEAGFPGTTDVEELATWVRPFDRVTVFATYASLGPGTLERAHAAGLSGGDLIVVDEAHRVSGRIGKPWAVVHDNTRIPSLRRLCMTATPRLWHIEDEERAGAPGELVPHRPTFAPVSGMVVGSRLSARIDACRESDPLCWVSRMCRVRPRSGRRLWDTSHEKRWKKITKKLLSFRT